MKREKQTALIFLIGGAVTFGFSSLFIKLCLFPATVIASFRMIIAGIVLVPFSYRAFIHLYREKGMSGMIILIIPGILLGLHFQLWVMGIKNTLIATGTFIFSVNPILFAAAERILYKRRVNLPSLISLLMVVTGAVWLFTAGNGKFGRQGDIYCLLATILFVFYLFSAKKLSAGVPHTLFIHLIYLWGGIATLPFIFITGDFYRVVFNDMYSLLFLLLLAIFPTLIGHTSNNYAVRLFSPLFVSFFSLFEPLLSGIAAYIFLHEKPALALYPGYFLLITASVVYLLSEFYAVKFRKN
ncbi:MAG: DMT family transporter [Spirochaetes bacterium]|nr:DMT family transporter [Spirochaetota bacterium]